MPWTMAVAKVHRKFTTSTYNKDLLLPWRQQVARLEDIANLAKVECGNVSSQIVFIS